MTNPCNKIRLALERYPGIRGVDAQEAAIDEQEGGVYPATLSITFHPNTLGFHTLEFLVWALADMRKAGAQVHHMLHAPPPWLSAPGQSLALQVYVNPQSDKVPEPEMLQEVAAGLEKMAAFFEDVYEQFWPLCAPGGT